MHTENATKTITKAVPTVDADGKVIKWDLAVEYLFDDYTSIFNKIIDIQPSKIPTSFTKAELWELIDKAHLDAVFESQYVSVKLAPATSTEALSDFNIDSLS